MISKTHLTSACLLIAFGIVGCATDNTSTATSSSKLDTSPEREIVLSAIEDFSEVDGATKLWYIDTDRKSLAVDAEQFKDQFAKVQTTFAGASGTYTIRLTALTEIDGESQYQVSIDNTRLALATNPESDTDFTAYVHQWRNVLINSGSKIEVSFNSATNGKIPEGETTAYSRGRWTKVEFIRQ